MYFDVNTTNLQELLEVLPFPFNASVIKVQKHIPKARALPNFCMSLTVWLFSGRSTMRLICITQAHSRDEQWYSFFTKHLISEENHIFSDILEWYDYSGTIDFRRGEWGRWGWWRFLFWSSPILIRNVYILIYLWCTPWKGTLTRQYTRYEHFAHGIYAE